MLTTGDMPSFGGTCLCRKIENMRWNAGTTMHCENAGLAVLSTSNNNQHCTANLRIPSHEDAD